MARARQLKPSFFRNEQLAECSPWARLLFAGLWTIADRDGRLEYRPKRIKAELFPFDAVEIHELAVELHGQKLLVLYEANGVDYISIPNFVKHQRPHPKEPSSGFPQPPSDTTTYEKAVEKHGEPEQNTASCAFPSSNPLILQSSNPSTPVSPPDAAPAAVVEKKTKSASVRCEDVEIPCELNTPQVAQALSDWLDHHRSKGSPYKSPKAVARLFEPYIREGPAAFIAAVNHSIGCNYQGLFPPRGGTNARAPIIGPGQRHDPNAKGTGTF